MSLQENRNNCDARNNVDERCVVVDHLSSTHEMLRRGKSKIKLNALTFCDVEEQDVAKSLKLNLTCSLSPMSPCQMSQKVNALNLILYFSRRLIPL